MLLRLFGPLFPSILVSWFGFFLPSDVDVKPVLCSEALQKFLFIFGEGFLPSSVVVFCQLVGCLAQSDAGFVSATGFPDARNLLCGHAADPWDGLFQEFFHGNVFGSRGVEYFLGFPSHRGFQHSQAKVDSGPFGFRVPCVCGEGFQPCSCIVPACLGDDVQQGDGFHPLAGSEGSRAWVACARFFDFSRQVFPESCQTLSFEGFSGVASHQFQGDVGKGAGIFEAFGHGFACACSVEFAANFHGELGQLVGPEFPFLFGRLGQCSFQSGGGKIQCLVHADGFFTRVFSKRQIFFFACWLGVLFFCARHFDFLAQVAPEFFWVVCYLFPSFLDVLPEFGVGFFHQGYDLEDCSLFGGFSRGVVDSLSGGIVVESRKEDGIARPGFPFFHGGEPLAGCFPVGCAEDSHQEAADFLLSDGVAPWEFGPPVLADASPCAGDLFRGCQSLGQAGDGVIHFVEQSADLGFRELDDDFFGRFVRVFRGDFGQDPFGCLAAFVEGCPDGHFSLVGIWLVHNDGVVWWRWCFV
jgi:hypothetical protein